MPTRRKQRPEPARQPKTLLAMLVGVAVLLVLTGGYLALLGGTTPQRNAIGGPFALTAADGQTVTDRSYAGQYLLVYFGYSACRDVCPTTLAALGDAMDVLGAKAGRLQPLFITVDPRRDTPDVLGRYVANFTPRLVGLTGSARQLRQVQQEYRVTSVAHTKDGETDYTVDHSSVLYLIAPDGRFVALIPADDSGAEMAARISRYVG